VPPQTKSERARRLRELDERLVAVHVAQRVGERAMLLLEVGDARGGRGTTEDYLHVHADLPDTHVGQLVPVVLRTSDDGTLRAYHDE
jgi:tRNA A37 methylthiotransferase MiaB